MAEKVSIQSRPISHCSAVERAGLSTLPDGQKINYEIEQDRRTGKSSAGNLSKAG